MLHYNNLLHILECLSMSHQPDNSVCVFVCVCVCVCVYVYVCVCISYQLTIEFKIQQFGTHEYLTYNASIDFRATLYLR